MKKPPKKTFFQLMKEYDDGASDMISKASALCDKNIDGECTVSRRKCPFKIHSVDGEYYCRKEVLEEAFME